MSQIHFRSNGVPRNIKIGIPVHSSGAILHVHQKPPLIILHRYVSQLEEGQLTQVTV